MSRVIGCPICPRCRGATGVTNTKPFERGKYRQRRRVCKSCRFSFPTYELHLTPQLIDLLHDHGYLIRVTI